MFQDADLKNHLETSSTVRLRSAVIAEWNMNSADNIKALGNYRYRPFQGVTSIYGSIINHFDAADTANFYTGATDADVVVDGGFYDGYDEDGNPVPLAFQSKKTKDKMLYSLEDCLQKFRPRSGINKLRFFDDKFTHFTTTKMAERPRYYMADRSDKFKYWSSYRTENGNEVGIANHLLNGRYYIDDAAPFVVYQNPVPANRLVVKMQTNTSDLDLGPFADSSGSFDDPFYGLANATVPVIWKVQYLVDNLWVTAASFNANSLRRDGSAIIKADGYLELEYGLNIPEKYLSIFSYSGEISSQTMLPTVGYTGQAYLLKTSELDLGEFHIWNDGGWQTFLPTYDWHVAEEVVDKSTNFVTDTTNPQKFYNGVTGAEQYREFEYISGIRVVVDTMNTVDSTFDLIELSPRLTVDLSEKATAFGITKSASDLGSAGMPVAQLLASTGSLTLFDYDQAFLKTNDSSIIKDHNQKNIQVKLYEIISDVTVDSLTLDYYVPIKTMYVDGIPEISNADRSVTLSLRDLFFYLESMTAPQLLIQNASVSYAISLLLDSIGFSNYVFKRNDGEDDMIIPYFIVAPDTNVAKVLQDIAVSTQSAMFFDEYNNLIVMSKNYMMPTEAERETDLTLYGTKDFVDTGIVNNERTQDKLSNIMTLSYKDSSPFNNGKITYTSRYIQRSYGALKQASLLDREKTWIYKPALLWEVSGTENTKSENDQTGNQSNYVLTAIPLSNDLTDELPQVVNGVLVNNIMNLGEGVYWIARYNGYFYANGEIIKYDAVEYNVSGIGDVWIKSVQEYQNYFSQMPFNGKIYPTGRVRIYAQPDYETMDGISRLKNGTVAKHGRMQFGTGVINNATGLMKPVFHQAGLAPYWSDNNNVRGCEMDSSYLFNLTNGELVVRSVRSTGVNFFTNSVVGIYPGQKVSFISGTGELSKNGATKIVSVSDVKNTQTNEYTFVVDKAPKTDLLNATLAVKFETVPVTGAAGTTTTVGAAGVSNTIATKTTRNGIIRNFMSSDYIEDKALNTLTKTNPATLQSSALVMSGPSFAVSEPNPIDFISYVYKKMDSVFNHFGTRMRIVGKVENNTDIGQTGTGGSKYYSIPTNSPNKNINIAGSSGGLGVMLNPETNNGYFMELVALSEADVSDYTAGEDIHNVIFYKIKKDPVSGAAIPVKLWGGITSILVDSGNFTGQARMVGEDYPTVYDIAVEHSKVANNISRFFLYINDKVVAVVDDNDPLPVYNNIALFTRGSAKIMFENLYAMSANYAQNTASVINTPVNGVFADKEVNASDSFRKYAMSGMVQSVFLSGINAGEDPKYRLYFEEFGTIMREAAYFNVRYDKAYPALYAKMSPTFNQIKGYVVSGFIAHPYGAEFLLFNATDSPLSLDEGTGNYLRIQGVTFTQESTHELTIDEYFSKVGDLANKEYTADSTISSSIKSKQLYKDIKESRLTYGNNEFTLDVPYVQTQDAATDLIGWVIEKTSKPRKQASVEIFAMPTVQLGDIVKIDYVNNDNVDEVGKDRRFVVYSIDYERAEDGPTMTVYLSEVI